MIGANLYNHMQLFQICCTAEGAFSSLFLLIILKMEGAFKLIAACFKGNSSSSAAAVVPQELCKGNNDKKKEKLGAKTQKAPIPTSYFPLGSNLSRL